MRISNSKLLDVPTIFNCGPNGTQLIRNPTCWRYLDLLSLLTLLKKEELHFTRLKDLQKYDPREGTGGLFTDVVNSNLQPSMLVIPATAASIQRDIKEMQDLNDKLNIPIQSQRTQFVGEINKWDQLNNNIHISCWHTNTIDIDFMWRVYGACHYGFAIEAEAVNLLNAFWNAGIARKKIGCGFVLYSTRDEIIRMQVPFDVKQYFAFLIKSPDFKPENELRIFVNTTEAVDSCDVPFDISTAIRCIHISPLMPEWAVDSVMEIVNQLCASKGLPNVVYRPRGVR
jgi:hypothetical protein